MPALFHGVMQRAVSEGSEQVVPRGDNTEQRADGKQPQKLSFTLTFTASERGEGALGGP